MKTLLIIEHDNLKEQVIEHLAPRGFDFIHYRNPIKAIDNIEEIQLYLSVITIGEIRKGSEILPNSERKAKLDTWLNEQLQQRFSGRIVNMDVDIMLRWGQRIPSVG